MKIGLVSSIVPHTRGDYRCIVDWLEPRLRDAGHRVERIYLPNAGGASGYLADMATFRMLDLAHSCDRIITFRPPAHALKHPSKIVWFIHHERLFYDLWDSERCPFPREGYWRAYRAAVHGADTHVLREAAAVFSNSRTVQRRLWDFNGIDAEILHPPIDEPNEFLNRGYGDEIVSVHEIDHHKRQHLLVEAMAHVRTGVKLRIAGAASDPSYVERLKRFVGRHNLNDRVAIEARWISGREKRAMLSSALAAAYLPFDEGGCGYPALEAAHAEKPTVTASDSGGPLEFIEDGDTGLVAAPDSRALAEVLDRLWTERTLAARLGKRARARISELGIEWSHVVSRLTA